MTDPRALDRQGARLLGGSVLILLLVASLVAWRQMNSPTLDPITLRAAGRPVSGEVLVLLDATDPLSTGQAGGVVEWLREFELTTLRPNERVTVWVLGTKEGGGLAQAFSRYYPGRDSDFLLHNPALSAARCESLFTGPLREVVVKTASGQHFSSSPILEAVHEIASEPEFAATGKRHLVVVSDLQENTPTLSFYRGVPDFAGFWRSSRGSELRADLHGAAVDILLVARQADGTSLGSRLKDFWKHYLIACGASRVRIRRV